MRILGRLITLLVFLFVAGGGLAAAVPGRTFADKCAWLERAREAGVYSVIGQPAKAVKASAAVKASRTEAAGKTIQVQTPAEEPEAKGNGSAPDELRVVSGDGKAKEIEQAVFKAINEARKANGVSAVEWFEPVAEMARLKAREVLETGEFSHISKKYGFCTDMYDRAGLHYTAGQEISRGASDIPSDLDVLAKELVDGWLNTPEKAHRSVLLGREYKQVGVGVAYANRPVRVVTRDSGKTAFGFSMTGEQILEVDALFITLAEDASGQ